ncbi:MAG TPA: tetratricopeptide repeat protein [Pyrinomonadaceae bacterium]|jgi:tetratricopeptide (TPR) repeat protein|nr:tetratricopeptide repeat protein [Pyrinomonadaceae bacterium]
MRLFLLCCVLVVVGIGYPTFAQIRDPTLTGRSGGKALYGDITVQREELNNGKPVKVDLILYTEGRNIVERNTVSGSGRYRFNNIPQGLYELVAEVEGQEVGRYRVDLRSPLVDDFKQDLAFAWTSTGPKSSKAVSAADQYKRNSSNAALFTKADSAINTKDYDEADKLLKKILASDPKDFQAWTEFGNVHLLQAKYSEAENEYLRAIDLHSDYFLALLNLGRAEIALKRFDVAADVLNRAVKLQPTSADANYFLGESYLQLKKGSLAVGYLNEALRLDPKGMAEVHLRLALLYHAAGLKDKAAAEYEAFLKQRPDYQDRKKLEDYISANKKP